MDKSRPKARLLTPQETADWLQISVETLRTWRDRRLNLPFVKVGSLVRYDPDDVEAYISRRRVPVRRVINN